MLIIAIGRPFVKSYFVFFEKIWRKNHPCRRAGVIGFLQFDIQLGNYCGTTGTQVVFPCKGGVHPAAGTLGYALAIALQSLQPD